MLYSVFAGAMRGRLEDESIDSSMLSSALELEPKTLVDDAVPVVLSLDVPVAPPWLIEPVDACTGIGSGRGNASE